MRAIEGAFAAMLVAAILGASTYSSRSAPLDPPSCAVPENLLFGDNHLKRVSAAVGKERRLNVVVLGSGSSALAGPDGATLAYPVRLEAALNQRLSGIAVKVTSQAKGAQSARDMRRILKSLLVDEKPDLVIWQTGTVDAMRRVAPDDFRTVLDSGVMTLQSGGADVILMNMQYSPRTESMIAVGPYAETMRMVAQQHDTPLFDRFAIMRYWSDHGAFDFYAPGKDNGLARRVHDCIGRALASLVIDAGQLKAFEVKAGR